MMPPALKRSISVASATSEKSAQAELKNVTVENILSHGFWPFLPDQRDSDQKRESGTRKYDVLPKRSISTHAACAPKTPTKLRDGELGVETSNAMSSGV